MILSLSRPTHLHPPWHPRPPLRPLRFSSASPSPQRTQQPLCTPTVLCLANNGPAPLTVHYHRYTYHHRSMHHCQASFSLTPINRGLLVVAVLNSARGRRVYPDNFLPLFSLFLSLFLSFPFRSTTFPIAGTSWFLNSSFPTSCVALPIPDCARARARA